MIRPEHEGDAPAVRRVHRSAFGGETEPQIVDEVRESEGWIPELSLVAEEGGEIVGHVLVSWASLAGTGRRVLLLGPIGVLPARQRKGIGGALVRAALEGARELGEEVVVLEGDPAYYSRFGFVRADGLGLLPPPSAPAWAFQVCPLHDGAAVPQGRLVYPPAFPQ